MKKLIAEDKKALVETLKSFSEMKRLTLFHIYDAKTSPSLIVHVDVKITDVKDDGAVYFTVGELAFPIRLGDIVEVNPASVIWEAETSCGGIILRQLFACGVRVETPQAAGE